MLFTDKLPDALHGFLACQQIAADTVFSVFLRGQKQDLRFLIRLIGKHPDEIVPVCAADDDAAFGNLQILFEKVRPSLEEALAAFVENEVIGVRIVAMVRQHKVNHVAVQDGVQYLKFLILGIRTVLPYRKALSGAVAAGVKVEL